VPVGSFAERHGPTFLLAAGILLILAGIAAVFTGHQLIAGGMWTTGLLAVAIAAMMSRMEGKFTLLGLSGNLKTSRPGSEGQIPDLPKPAIDETEANGAGGASSAPEGSTDSESSKP
jgi:hypothetical protein